MRATIRRLEQDQRSRAWLAYHTAALGRIDKMPRFSDFVGRTKAKPKWLPPQSSDVLLAQLKAVHVAYGGSPKDFQKVE